MSTFAERLSRTRKDKKITQKKAAEFLGITPNAYQKYEYATREPDIHMLIQIADFFDVSIDYLFGRTENPSAHRKQQRLLASPLNILCVHNILQTVHDNTSSRLVMRYAENDDWPLLRDFQRETVLYHIQQLELYRLIFKVDWTQDPVCLIYGLTANGESLLSQMQNPEKFAAMERWLTGDDSHTLGDLINHVLH